MRIQHKSLAVLAGSATLVAGVALWPSAAGADPDREGRGGKTVELTFVSDRVEQALIDNGATGLSLGDEFVYTNIVTLEDGTATATGECTAHQVTTTRVTWNCIDTSSGDLGTLTAQGSFQIDLTTGRIVGEEVTSAITGGTDEFQRARGQITFTSEGAGLDTVTRGTVRVHLR